MTVQSYLLYPKLARAALRKESNPTKVEKETTRVTVAVPTLVKHPKVKLV